MKAWSQPEMEELNVRATAYSPKGGLIEDGVYYPHLRSFFRQFRRTYRRRTVVFGLYERKMPEWIREAHGYMGFFGVYDESACSINRRRQSV